MNTNILFLGTLTILAIVAMTVWIGLSTNQVFGESFTGTATNVVSATSTSVGPDSIITVFPANAQCDNRIVTTGAQGVRISFRTIEGFTLTNALGHYQAASTTASYNSGLYGCGNMQILGLSASSTIIISETQ